MFCGFVEHLKDSELSVQMGSQKHVQDDSSLAWHPLEQEFQLKKEV